MYNSLLSHLYKQKSPKPKKKKKKNFGEGQKKKKMSGGDNDINPAVYLSLVLFVLGTCAGVLPLYVPSCKSGNMTRVGVAFAAGTILGAALMFMLPESFESATEEIEDAHDSGVWVGAWTIAGFFFIYASELVAHPHIGHEEEQHWGHDEGEEHANETDTERTDLHPTGWVPFLALLFHSIIDGVALGANAASGGHHGDDHGGDHEDESNEIQTSDILIFIALLLHKLPTGFALTSILQQTHEKKSTVIGAQILFNLMVPLGAFIAFFAIEDVDGKVFSALLGFSAGTFMHIATGDLLPVIHRQHGTSRAPLLLCFLLGILIALVLAVLTKH